MPRVEPMQTPPRPTPRESTEAMVRNISSPSSVCRTQRRESYSCLASQSSRMELVVGSEDFDQFFGAQRGLILPGIPILSVLGF